MAGAGKGEDAAMDVNNQFVEMKRRDFQFTIFGLALFLLVAHLLGLNL